MYQPSLGGEPGGQALAARQSRPAALARPTGLNGAGVSRPVMCVVWSVLAFFTAVQASAQDEEVGKFEVHEWSFWAIDPTQDLANPLNQYSSAMPGPVETERTRVPKESKAMPVSVMTFHGQPAADLEVEVQIPSGRALAVWPPARRKNNRLRWLELSQSVEPFEGARTAPVDATHWFERARGLDSLYVRAGARQERFLTYDIELPFAVPLRLEGGPDVYRVVNLSPWELADLIISVPTPQGRRIGRVSSVPAKAAAPARKEQQPSPTGSAPDSPKNPTAPGGTRQATDERPKDDRPGGQPSDGQASESEASESEASESEASESEASESEGSESEASDGEASDGEASDGEASGGEASDDRPAGEQQKNGSAQDGSKTQQSLQDQSGVVQPAESQPNASSANAAANLSAAGAGPPGEADAAADRAASPGAGQSADAPADAVDVVMSAPLPENAGELVAARTQLAESLVAAGLAPGEAELVASLISDAVFNSTDLVVLVRLPQAVADEKLPLVFYPAAAKIVRVPLLLVRKVDPRIQHEIKQLVVQLGSNVYAEREAADKRLRELGRLAIPALKECLTSPDLEVVLRAERMLLALGESIDPVQQPNNQAAPGGAAPAAGAVQVLAAPGN